MLTLNTKIKGGVKSPSQVFRHSQREDDQVVSILQMSILETSSSGIQSSRNPVFLKPGLPGIQFSWNPVLQEPSLPGTQSSWAMIQLFSV